MRAGVKGLLVRGEGERQGFVGEGGESWEEEWDDIRCGVGSRTSARLGETKVTTL